MSGSHEIQRHPSCKVFLTAFIDKCFAGDLDVVPSLGDINSVEQIEVALAFDGYIKSFVQHV